MSESKHTPGPRRVGPDGFTVNAGSEFVTVHVATCFINSERGVQSPSIQEANARLIAAAPELLSLLEELTDIEGPLPGNAAWAEKVRAAISKAKGQP